MGRISFFKTTTDTTPVAQTEPNKILVWIKAGQWQKKVEHLRSIEDKDEAREFKKTLPAATFSGEFSERNIESLVEYSKLVVMDFDHVDNLDRYKESFVKDEYIYSCFVSPSGTGMKVIVKVDCEANYHINAWVSLAKYFEDKYGLGADKSGKDVSRLCYVSYDPEAYINEDSAEWHVDITQPILSSGKHDRPAEKFSGKKVSSDVQYVFNVATKWVERTHQYMEGGRNAYIHCLACTLNRCGVTHGDAIHLIDTNFITPDNKWHQSVTSAYTHNKKEHNSINVYELEKDGVKTKPIPEYVEGDYDPEEDVVNTTALLLKHKIDIPSVKNIIHNYAWKLAFEKHFEEMTPKKLNDLMSKGFHLNESSNPTTSNGNDLKIEYAEDMLAGIIDSMGTSEAITTFDDFDRVNGGGLQPGNFYGIIGHGGSFKSIISQWIAAENAKRDKLVLYLNGEMSPKQFYSRLFNKEMLIDFDQELKEGKINKDNIAEWTGRLNAILKHNLPVVSATGFSEDAILKAVDKVSEDHKKEVGLIIIDGITQMEDVKKNEIHSAIHNSLIAKEIAKGANGGKGAAVIGLYHIAGGCSKHTRNTNDFVRGGQKVISAMDGFFCTSLLIDAATMDQAGDDVAYQRDKLFLRYFDKRGSGEQVDKIIQITKPMKCEPMEIDPSNFEIKT